MNKTILLIVTVICVIAISYNLKQTFGADPGDDAATCAISITVDTIIEWEGANFAALAPANITAQASAPEDSETYTLWTNCNVTLSADQTAAAELTHSRGVGGSEDTLVTKYKIATDGDGDPATGATATAVSESDSDGYVTYDAFLETALAITHYNTDGAVEVTLSVQAANDADNVADTGLYEAVQTITAAWASDN